MVDIKNPNTIGQRNSQTQTRPRLRIFLRLGRLSASISPFIF